MTLRCIAIDDEPLALDLLRNYIGRSPALQLIQVFEDAVTAAEFLRDASIDLVFIDIQMPDISGVDLIRSLPKRPLFVFTTAFKEYAWQGYELEATDYLLKPFSFERFSKAVQKALDTSANPSLAKEQPDDNLFVFVEYKLVKIPLHKIQYIESLEDYIRIHILDEASVMTLLTLKKVLEKIPAARFQRIHRSYIVNSRYIKSINQKKVELLSGITIPVGDAYGDNLQQWIR